MGLTWDQWFMAALVVVVFTALVKEWVAVELVALGALFVCIVSGILPITPKTPEEAPFRALNVFSHSAPLTIACMFIVSAALEKTGVVEKMGFWFEEKAAKSQTQMLFCLILIAAGLSGFMNNTPVVVVFMPIIIGICRRKDWKPTRFLIPLSYAAIVGGTVTIVGTSTNLIASGIAEQRGMKTFSLFEIAPLGIVFIAVTTVYLMTVGRKLLPDRLTLAALVDSKTSRQFMTHATIRENSPLIGKSIKESLGKIRKARIAEVYRNGAKILTPLDEIVFGQGDEVVVKGDLDALIGVSRTEGLQLADAEDLGLEEVRVEATTIMEGIIGPNSSFIGKTLKELRFRNQYGIIVVALHRQGKNLTDRIGEIRLQFGDTLLVQGAPHRMQRLFQSKNFINLSEPEHESYRPEKAKYALLALASFVVLGALGGFGVISAIPVFALAFGAALFCLFTRCIEPKEAYEAIEWRVIFMIMGMLGLGLGLEKTGLAKTLADLLVGAVDSYPPVVLIAVLYLFAAILTEVISNQAVAALLTPIAITVGLNMGLDPRALVIAVMFGSSASFSTPIGYQTNTFVYGAGGYKFSDFFKVGFPLAIILWIVASFLIPIIWPLQ